MTNRYNKVRDLAINTLLLGNYQAVVNSARLLIRVLPVYETGKKPE